eukprot:TRINITY_DN4927_c0_g2_i1.p1 TRINITY_DN4927_c0_g2~~TRINITY_DN4927_c0_g2_i1.p1  ORF type:complete len:300 (-),score=46.82 TRINITY_DN4927_c0_g2_i1:62-961(-)
MPKNRIFKQDSKSNLGPGEHKQFLYAASIGDKTVLERWLKKGVDVNYNNIHGETAIYLATGAGSLECVKVLVDSGADWSMSTKSKQSVLHNAAAAGSEILLEFYRNLGFDKIDTESWDGSTELLVAARSGNDTILSYLINKGADMNYRDLNGLTALHYSVRSNHIDCVLALCSRGAKVNLLTYLDGERGECPLHCAMRDHSHRSVSILLQHGAKITCCFSCRRGRACSRVSPQMLDRVRTEIKLRKKSLNRPLTRTSTQTDLRMKKEEEKKSLSVDTTPKSTSFLSKFFQRRRRTDPLS